jgi:hypothetical protein
MIMLAGAVFLFQLAGQDDAEPPVEIGDTVTVGDMAVTVTDATERSGVLDVDVVIGGVEDPDGSDGFRLIAAGRPVSPDSDFAGACAATTTSDSHCLVRFDVSGADGSSRVLLYTRGDDQARWVLS